MLIRIDTVEDRTTRLEERFSSVATTADLAKVSEKLDNACGHIRTVEHGVKRIESLLMEDRR
ncbi:MAG: hypothetical protein ACXW3D_01305 [Caulobacteraceae bacterium]